jgi:hypothetical protein
MNPDQLWETAMDPKTHALLQFSIEDALEADSWYIFYPHGRRCFRTSQMYREKWSICEKPGYLKLNLEFSSTCNLQV